jgi:shikimate 5-dehydrogenase
VLGPDHQRCRLAVVQAGRAGRRRVDPPAPRPALQPRAVAVALGSSNAQVTIYARDLAKAQDVAMTASAAAAPLPPPLGSWDLLVNCTPVGMYPKADATPIEQKFLTGRYVYDLVYNPTTTRLMKEGEKAGCQTIGGLEMLVAQAVEQFEWWTGSKPPALQG